MEACLESRPSAEFPQQLRESIDLFLGGRDGEPKYAVGALLARCGERRTALRLIRRAIEQNYCSYPPVDTDPLLENVRGTPEFGSIRSAAIECQKGFLEHRRKAP